MSTVDHLTEILDQKNREIQKLQERLEDLECQVSGSRNGWCVHRTMTEPQTLPVPRLEIVWDKVSEFLTVAKYRLIYRHLAGNVIAIPMGETKVSGSNKYANYQGKIDLPFRDGAHIAYDSRTLGLPAFVTLDGVSQSIPPRDTDPNVSITKEQEKE